MKKTIATMMMTLGLTACLSEDGREQSSEDRVTGGEAALGILSWAGQEAAGFVLGTIFDISLPENDVHLSQESLDEIRNIVDQELLEDALNDQAGQVQALINDYDEFYRPACRWGATPSGECSVSSLDTRYDEADEVSDTANEIYEDLISWATNNEDQGGSDQSWQVFLAGNIKLTAVIDIAMKRHMYEIERLKGSQHETNARSALDNLTRAASRYSAVFGAIEDKYDSIVEKFGDIRPVDIHLNTFDGTERHFKYCFDAPEGEDCSQQRSTYCAGGYCSSIGPEEGELLEEATQLRQDRLDTFEAMVIDKGGNLSDLQTEMDKIAALEHSSFEPGCPSIDIGNGLVMFRNYVDGDLYYTLGLLIIRRTEDGYWDYVDHSVQPSQELDKTVTKPFWPWEGEWRSGTRVECIGAEEAE